MEKKKVGAPKGSGSTYTPEMAKRICDLVEVNTCGLARLKVLYPDIPPETTIQKWRKDHPEFGADYARAKVAQAGLLAEEIIEIADEVENDTIIDENGKEKFNHEFAARAKIRIDARKWLASKLLPKVYGDKVQSETSVTIKHEDALKDLL